METPTPDLGRRQGLVRRALDRGLDYFSRSIWELDLADLSWGGKHAVRAARIGYLATRGFADKRCMVRASALTYVTILSIVPLLAFVFSVAKGFGFYEALLKNQVEPFLDEVFGQRGEGDLQSVRVALDQVLTFVQATDFTKLAWAGAVILVYAVIRLLGTVERSLNDIWGVTRERPFFRKVSDYLSMLVVTPILLFVGAGLVSAARSEAFVEWVGANLGSMDVVAARLQSLLMLVLGLSSMITVWLGFTFLYKAMPNTGVPFASAALGGLCASALWLLVQFLHVQLQLGVARYNEIYSSFAALPLFMVWLNACWVVVLFGAAIAYAHQSEPSQREVRVRFPDVHAFRERVALRAAGRVAGAFLRGDVAPTAGELAVDLGVPVRSVNEAVELLERCGLLADTRRGEDRGYLPARPPEAISVRSVLDALRGPLALDEVPPRSPLDHEIERVLTRFDEVLERSGEDRTLRDLAREDRPA